MAKFLNTSGTTFFLEELIKNTSRKLVLVSPYLQINTRIKQLIEDANNSGIEIDFLYGKNNLHKDEKNWLSTLDNVCVRFCENLHAKCYLNEKSAIITSMNLYEFSQVNNNEVGILIQKETDTECYFDTENETTRLFRISEEHKPRIVKKNALAVLESNEPPAQPKRTGPAEEIYEKLTTAKIAENCKVKTTQLYEYFLSKGYLEVKDGKHYLTEKGKEKGAEFRMGKAGPYFLWPKTMLKKFQS